MIGGTGCERSCRPGGPSRSSGSAPPKPNFAAPDFSAPTRQGMKSASPPARNLRASTRRRLCSGAASRFQLDGLERYLPKPVAVRSFLEKVRRAVIALHACVAALSTPRIHRELIKPYATLKAIWSPACCPPLSLGIHIINPGEHIVPHRRNSCALYHILQGSGYSGVGEHGLEWTQRYVRHRAGWAGSRDGS
jgi:hypothetical protein